MPQPRTVRRWQGRLTWPAILGAIWLIMYTSLQVFGMGYAAMDQSAFEVLFSVQHLSHPLGWLFIVSLLLTAVGITLHVYAFWAEY